MSLADEPSERVRPGYSRRSSSCDRGDGAADFAEILEYDAEQHGIAGGDITAAYPRLGDRADECHAFILVNRRQGPVKAGARGLRRRHIVYESGAVRQVDRLGSLHGPIASEPAGKGK